MFDFCHFWSILFSISQFDKLYIKDIVWINSIQNCQKHMMTSYRNPPNRNSKKNRHASTQRVSSPALFKLTPSHLLHTPEKHRPAIMEINFGIFVKSPSRAYPKWENPGFLTLGVRGRCDSNPHQCSLVVKNYLTLTCCIETWPLHLASVHVHLAISVITPSNQFVSC